MNKKLILGYSILAISLPLSMQAQGISEEVIQNAVFATYANPLQQPLGLQQPTGLLAYLLNPRNMAQGQWNLKGVRDLYARASADGKGKRTIILPYTKNLPFTDEGNWDTDTDFCSNTPSSLETALHPYTVQRTTSDSMSVKMGDARCKVIGAQAYYQETVNALINRAVSKFAVEVEREMFSKNSDGTYRFIGDIPYLQEGVTRPSGETVCLFYENTDFIKDRINDNGVTRIETDLLNANVMLNSYVEMGGTAAATYWKAAGKQMVGGTSFNPSLAQVVGDAKAVYTPMAGALISGVEKPLIIIQDGAIQLLTFNRYANDDYKTDGLVKRTTIQDPYFGLTWDLRIQEKTCADDVEYTIYVRLSWGLIGSPRCEGAEPATRKGVTGVWYYNIGCCNTSACDNVQTAHNPSVAAQDFDQDCSNPDEVCLPASSCSVNLRLIEQANGDIFVLANGIPALGGSITNYEFFVDGASVQTGTGNTYTIPAGEYANGDIVSVTITGSLGCTATAQTAISVQIPQMTVSFGNGIIQAIQTNGGSFAAPSVTNGGADGTVLIQITNISPVNLTISNVTSTPSAVGVSTYTPNPYPVVKAPAGTDDTTLNYDADATPGTYSAVITVTSNDGNSPIFQSTINWTVLA